jgi:hypothetical protein
VREQLAGVSVELCAGVRCAEPGRPWLRLDGERWRGYRADIEEGAAGGCRLTALSVLSATSRTNAGAAERGEGGAGAYDSEAPQLGVGRLKSQANSPGPTSPLRSTGGLGGITGFGERGNSLAGGSTVKPLAILVVVARSR